MKYNDAQPKAPEYIPEKPNHVRTVFKTLFFMLIYHFMSWLLYDLILRTPTNQMMADDLAARAEWTMFVFSLICLLVISVVLQQFYLKNGDRKRAYLAATSVEVRGAENAAEGVARYRKLAFKEGLLCTLATGGLWLIPAAMYTLFLSTSGQGFGYAQAYGIEKFFVGFVGLCEPFHNAWIGYLLGLGILFVCHYFGRLHAHQKWGENRIRR